MKSQFIVTAEHSRKTIAATLRAALPEVTWSQAKEWCRRGQVMLNGVVVTDEAMRVQAGAQVNLDTSLPPPKPASKVAIVYEDAHVVVINKPSGISSVPYEKRDSDTAMDYLRQAWRTGDGSPQKRATEIALHVVHRIDKETSGLLAFAKTKAAERGLSDLFRAHDVERTYLCVAHGAVEDRRLESRLVVDRGDGLRGSVRTAKAGVGKRAVTHVKILERLPESSLCEVRLETGKTHQIRIHLAEDRHPLVGEKVYIRDYLRAGNTPIDCPRLLLHAATLGFKHPITAAMVRLSAPLPADFEAALKRLRKPPKTASEPPASKIPAARKLRSKSRPAR